MAGSSDIRRAKTLPASWYSSAYHHERELLRVWSAHWVCVGDAFEMPAAGSWRAITVGRTPVLLVRDREGQLRAFLNVCRHRAAPLCEPGDDVSGAALSCPYHAWLYRLDGTLARAQGVGEPEGFDLADHSLNPAGVATWRRWVFVHADANAPAPDFGSLTKVVDDIPLEAMDIAVSERDERAFNWKVLLENYSENYHTPFIHPEIDTTATHDYPMVSDGLMLHAWDRPRSDSAATATAGQPYDGGNYLTVFPNLMLNVFPNAAMAMWVEPTSRNRTVVHRRLYGTPGADLKAFAANVAAHKLVHAQDVDICLRVQRSHDAGINANGVLSTVEEQGVFWFHELLRGTMTEAV